MQRDYYYNSRLLCDVLEEMRQADKTKNYAGLRGLIEEAQCMGNRMETGLEGKRDLARMHEMLKEKERELRKLDKKIEKRQRKLDDK